MIRPSSLFAAFLCLAASHAYAAGFRTLEVSADGVSRPLRGAIWYPCSQPTSNVTIGPIVMSVAKDCPMTGEKLPLLVISHGWGGTFLGHRDTAEALANAGFIVVAVNHGDSALDKGRINDFSAFVERPADIKRVIDYMLEAWPDAARIDASRIGMFGFSRGGYTALVAISANPQFGKRLRLCEGNSDPLCDQVHKGELPELTHDPRIKAAVVADPLSVFFTQDSFKDVTVPVQLWGSEYGGDGVAPESVVAIASRLPMKSEFHAVPNSQHFDFLPPCSAELAKSAPEICGDDFGFDRAAFHKQFNAAVLAFFRKHLVDA